MADNTPSQSFVNPDTQNQQHENVVRQGYVIQEVGGHMYTIPTSFPIEKSLTLNHTHEPDYSKAADMPAGVRIS